MEITFIPDSTDYETIPTKIKMIGVGGAGGNAIASMIKSGIDGVDYLVANTDVQDLNKSLASKKILLGPELQRGRGAGGKPETGKQAAEESIDNIEEAIKDAQMLFVIAGMGGGTGTGATPIILKKAREMGILTLAIVTLPFDYEKQDKFENASLGIKDIQSCADSMIVIPNSRITETYEDLSFDDAFEKADTIVVNAAISISEIINKVGRINIDFSDVDVVLKDKGFAMIGIGFGEGENRAITAANDALTNPLLNDIDLTSCNGLLINITAGKDFGMKEFDTINKTITSVTGSRGYQKTGLMRDEAMNGTIKITIVAAGLTPSEAVKALPTFTFDTKKNSTIKEFKVSQSTIFDSIEQKNNLNRTADVQSTNVKTNRTDGIPLFKHEDFDDNPIIKVADMPVFLKKNCN